MAENEISDYFETDLSNVDISGITVQENVMKPSNVNNAFRALQGALKRWFKTSLFRLRDSTDQTKLVAFDASGLTTATTRTYVFPNKNGTFALTLDAIMPSFSLAASVAGSALTIALKGADGADPSASNVVNIPFRNVSLTDGTISTLAVSAATSLVISSGSTMGFTSATAGRLWIVGFNDGGTFRIGAINCLSGFNVYPLSGNGIGSSTAEGGAGAADSAWVFYTGTAVASKAYTILGYLDWASGLATAGTWASGPTTINVFRPGNKLPGDTVQQSYGTYTPNGDVTATFPFDDTKPQVGEGTQLIVTGALTPSGAANVWRARFSAQVTPVAAVSDIAIAAIFSTNPGADAIVTTYTRPLSASSNAAGTMAMECQWLPGTVSAQTVQVRTGSTAGSSFRFNGNSSGRLFGGSMAATLVVEEIMS